jgi:hypothetical protein
MKKKTEQQTTDLQINALPCKCGCNPHWTWFKDEDGNKQYIFYCSNKACPFYRIAVVETDFVDAFDTWNETTGKR